MLKTSDVNSVPGMHQVRRSRNCIFLSGDVAAVKAAVDAVKENPPL